METTQREEVTETTPSNRYSKLLKFAAACYLATILFVPWRIDHIYDERLVGSKIVWGFIFDAPITGTTTSLYLPLIAVEWIGLGILFTLWYLHARR